MRGNLGRSPNTEVKAMSKMSCRDESKYRERLTDLRATLKDRLIGVQGEIGVTLSADSEEQANELENRDVLIALGNEATAELAEVERALARMDSGVYGTCARCAEPITPARLDAYPAATLCVECAKDVSP